MSDGTEMTKAALHEAWVTGTEQKRCPCDDLTERLLRCVERGHDNALPTVPDDEPMPPMGTLLHSVNEMQVERAVALTRAREVLEERRGGFGSTTSNPPLTDDLLRVAHYILTGQLGWDEQ